MARHSIKDPKDPKKRGWSAAPGDCVVGTREALRAVCEHDLITLAIRAAVHTYDHTYIRIMHTRVIARAFFREIFFCATICPPLINPHPPRYNFFSFLIFCAFSQALKSNLKKRISRLKNSASRTFSTNQLGIDRVLYCILWSHLGVFKALYLIWFYFAVTVLIF